AQLLHVSLLHVLPRSLTTTPTASSTLFLPPDAKPFFFFFKQKTAYEIGLGIPAEPLFRSPRLTLMSLIKMMLVMVSVAAISKTFGLLRFLLRLSFLAK